MVIDSNIDSNEEVKDTEILESLKENLSSLKMKNYYVFSPYAFICAWVQADKEGLVETENGSQVDKICKQKKCFRLSDWIRKLWFVSPETIESVLKEVVEKLETLVEENKILWQENMNFSLELSSLKKKLKTSKESEKEVVEKLEDLGKLKDDNIWNTTNPDEKDPENTQTEEKPAVEKTKNNTTKK